MPHIIINACNTEANMQTLHIHAQVHFSQEYYNSGKKAEVLLAELHQDLQALTEKYFGPYYESDKWIRNHDYNKHQPNENDMV